VDGTGPWTETIFCVDTKPWLIADPDIRGKNLEFLNGIDADYFIYCLEAHANAEESESRHASVALQSTLHHALETLFSLIGVLVQAHNCGYAWIAKCQNSDLIKLVNKISACDDSLFTKLLDLDISWSGIASVIVNLCQQESHASNPRQQADSLGKCLSLLSLELIDGNSRDEYNSIKHGFRIKSGGYKLWMSTNDNAIRAPHATSDKMALITESEYGASFFKLIPLSASKKERGLKPSRVYINWNLTRTIMLIEIAYTFIINVTSALKRLNGVTDELVCMTFPDPRELEKPWQLAGRSFMQVSGDHNPIQSPYVSEGRLNERIKSMRAAQKGR
jgi:hypothetical protein